VTAITESTENTENAEEPTPPKYATYRELALATWKLAYTLSDNGGGSRCVPGVNEYLNHFGLPDLHGSMDERYFDAWFQFKNWDVEGDLTPEQDAEKRDRLARSIRVYLQRREPDTVAVMNGWLTELGLDPFPKPQISSTFQIRHRGERSEMDVTKIREALQLLYPNHDIDRVRWY
jgi:hypothetical protein